MSGVDIADVPYQAPPERVRADHSEAGRQLALFLTPTLVAGIILGVNIGLARYAATSQANLTQQIESQGYADVELLSSYIGRAAICPHPGLGTISELTAVDLGNQAVDITVCQQALAGPARMTISPAKQ